MQGIIGKKLGMTQVYDDDGRRAAVTVIEAGPCVVLRRKTQTLDGYDAVQLAFGDQKEQRVSRSRAGEFKKAGVSAKRVVREFEVSTEEEAKAGDPVTVSIFEGVGFVDVVGTSKGRGFQGAVKRHGMRGGRMTHGGHSKRRIGAIGQCAYPGRVAKGQRMPGHMGNVRVTTQNLRLLGVREEDNVLLVRGAVPGPAGGIVIVKKALKKS